VLRSSSVIAHFVAEPKECASDGHASGSRGRFLQDERELFIAVTKLDPADDGITVTGSEPGQRRLIAPPVFFFDCKFQWGGAAVRRGLAEFLGWVPGCVPETISDAVQKGASEVAEECTFALRLKRAKVTKCLQDGVLNNVSRVYRVSRPSRDSTVSPAVQRRQVALKESIEGTLVSGPGTSEKFLGGRIRNRRSGVTGNRFNHTDFSPR
jgi:hypothetical protein